MLVQATIVVLATTFCVVSGAPTNETSVQSKIVRPCCLDDYECIGDNLAANSICNQKVRGFLPSQYILKTFDFDTPYFNSSYRDYNLLIRNHNKCFVSEFFINTETQNVVLSLDCPALDLESDRVIFRHNSMQEDGIYSYHIRSYYPLVRLTTTLHHVKKLHLCSAFTFADVTALPKNKIIPYNLPTVKFLSRDLSLLPIFERETFFYRAKQLARYFINSLICDFACNF